MVYKDIVITIPKNKKYIILRLFYQENKLFQCYKVVGRDCYHIGHNRTHTGEKPYYCSQFAEAFSQNIHSYYIYDDTLGRNKTNAVIVRRLSL